MKIKWKKTRTAKLEPGYTYHKYRKDPTDSFLYVSKRVPYKHPPSFSGRSCVEEWCVDV